MDYVTPDEIITQYTTALSTQQIAIMGLICSVASRAVETYCGGRRFYTTTGDEVLLLDGPRIISRYWHPQFDIASVTTLEIAEDNVRASSGTFTVMSTGDFFLQPGDRPEGWPAQWIEVPEFQSSSTYPSSAPFMHFRPYPRSIRFTGKRGWNTTSVGSSWFPQEIRLATAELAVKMWRTRDSGFATNIGYQDIATSVVERTLSPMTLGMIERYRKPSGMS